jgi:predicted amidophosphoribosyltransferase
LEIKNTGKCPSCGTEVSEDTAFCPQCGAKLN